MGNNDFFAYVKQMAKDNNVDISVMYDNDASSFSITVYDEVYRSRYIITNLDICTDDGYKVIIKELIKNIKKKTEDDDGSLHTEHEDA